MKNKREGYESIPFFLFEEFGFGTTPHPVICLASGITLWGYSIVPPNNLWDGTTVKEGSVLHPQMWKTIFGIME